MRLAGKAANPQRTPPDDLERKGCAAVDRLQLPELQAEAEPTGRLPGIDEGGVLKGRAL
jgi:hypothetical protein